MSEPGRRRVVDGALFGLYEDDEPEQRLPKVALGALLVAALVVVLLVWRAVNTDAPLELPAAEQVEPTTTTTPAPPTAEQLRLLLPAGIDDCAPPPGGPTDGPHRAVLRCAAPGGPGTVDFSLYPSVAERDDAFDFLAALVEVPDATGECALGRPGRHDYVGVEQVGQLACRSVDGRTDLLWTSDRGPLLAVATGEGSFADQYGWWAGLVERTDATFPVRAEQALLDRLPDALVDRCDRDPDLRLLAGGDLAITCRPERSPARVVSWIEFTDDADMAAWLAARRQQLGDHRAADAPEGCTASDYELAGRTGSVLCHLDPAGRAVVAWARDHERLGSVAVGADGVAITELFAWWERGGHLP